MEQNWGFFESVAGEDKKRTKYDIIKIYYSSGCWDPVVALLSITSTDDGLYKLERVQHTAHEDYYAHTQSLDTPTFFTENTYLTGETKNIYCIVDF